METKHIIPSETMSYLEEIFLETEGLRTLIAYITRDSDSCHYNKEIYDYYLQLYLNKYKEQELIKSSILANLPIEFRLHDVVFDFDTNEVKIKEIV